MCIQITYVCTHVCISVFRDKRSCYGVGGELRFKKYSRALAPPFWGMLQGEALEIRTRKFHLRRVRMPILTLKYAKRMSTERVSVRVEIAGGPSSKDNDKLAIVNMKRARERKKMS